MAANRLCASGVKIGIFLKQSVNIDLGQIRKMNLAGGVQAIKIHCSNGAIVVNQTAINFQQKFSLFTEQWSPKVIAEMNDYQFKIVRLKGEFIWHDHTDTDETFIVIEGHLRIDFRDGAVSLAPGEMFVVPKGVEHKPFAEDEAKILLIEPRGIVNTGHEPSDRTAPNDVWI